jgi:hypothetical protein
MALHGSSPIVRGLETSGPSDGRRRRMLSTGTNLVTQSLRRNCVIPERAALYGPAATKKNRSLLLFISRVRRKRNAHRTASSHPMQPEENIRQSCGATSRFGKGLIGQEGPCAIITSRNLWRWMQTMCRNPDAPHWPHYSQCPNSLKQQQTVVDNN